MHVIKLFSGRWGLSLLVAVLVSGCGTPEVKQPLPRDYKAEGEKIYAGCMKATQLRETNTDPVKLAEQCQQRRDGLISGMARFDREVAKIRAERERKEAAGEVYQHPLQACPCNAEYISCLVKQAPTHPGLGGFDTDHSTYFVSRDTRGNIVAGYSRRPGLCTGGLL